MGNRCKNCRHRGLETMGDVGSCNCCDNGEYFSFDTTPGYHKSVVSEPFILEPEDWTAEEWTAFCKLCGIPAKLTERIVLHISNMEYYISNEKEAINIGRKEN